jgi:hypothetical protein
VRTEAPYKNKPFQAGISQWPRGLRRESAASRLLGLRVRIPPEAWMSVCCECCVLSGRDLCVGLITRPEEYYRLWCVWVWSRSLDNEEAPAHWGLLRHGGSNNPPCLYVFRVITTGNNYFHNIINTLVSVLECFLLMQKCINTINTQQETIYARVTSVKPTHVSRCYQHRSSPVSTPAPRSKRTVLAANMHRCGCYVWHRGVWQWQEHTSQYHYRYEYQNAS